MNTHAAISKVTVFFANRTNFSHDIIFRTRRSVKNRMPPLLSFEYKGNFAADKRMHENCDDEKSINPNVCYGSNGKL